MNLENIIAIIFGISGWVTVAISHIKKSHADSRALATDFRRRIQDEKTYTHILIADLKATNASATLNPNSNSFITLANEKFTKITNELEMIAESICDGDIAKKHCASLISELKELYDVHILMYTLLTRLAQKHSYTLPIIKSDAFSSFYQVVEENVSLSEITSMQQERQQLGLPLSSDSKIPSNR